MQPGELEMWLNNNNRCEGEGWGCKEWKFLNLHTGSYTASGGPET